MTSADVLVIGDGLIGLSTAIAVGRDAKICVVGKPSNGIASTAAAGLLIPALDRLPASARPFYSDSLARFPQFIDTLRQYDPALTFMRGVIERSGGVEHLRQADGAVDNVRLFAALRRAVADRPNIRLVDDHVVRVERAADDVIVATTNVEVFHAKRVVLAAGAWVSQIKGLPRTLHVRPLKGQMIAFDAKVLTHAMMGDDIYLVPRGDETIVGATADEAGFDTSITAEATEFLRTRAVALCPALANAKVSRSWTGIRPATPDMLPILGPDPDWPQLVYACGHSKNGVLLTPATAAAIGAVCRGEEPPVDIGPFSIARFF